MQSLHKNIKKNEFRYALVDLVYCTIGATERSTTMPVGCGTSRVSTISGEVGWNTERDVERGETKVLVFSKHERVVVTWAWSNKGTTRERNVFCTSL